MGFKKNDPYTIQRSSHRKRLTCFLIVSTKVGTDQNVGVFKCSYYRTYNNLQVLYRKLEGL